MVWSLVSLGIQTLRVQKPLVHSAMRNYTKVFYSLVNLQSQNWCHTHARLRFWYNEPLGSQGSNACPLGPQLSSLSSRPMLVISLREALCRAEYLQSPRLVCQPVTCRLSLLILRHLPRHLFQVYILYSVKFVCIYSELFFMQTSALISITEYSLLSWLVC